MKITFEIETFKELQELVEKITPEKYEFKRLGCHNIKVGQIYQTNDGGETKLKIVSIGTAEFYGDTFSVVGYVFDSLYVEKEFNDIATGLHVESLFRFAERLYELTLIS